MGTHRCRALENALWHAPSGIFWVGGRPSLVSARSAASWRPGLAFPPLTFELWALPRAMITAQRLCVCAQSHGSTLSVQFVHSAQSSDFKSGLKRYLLLKG